MLQSALFEYANLTGANLAGADIALANFSYAALANANLNNTLLTGVSITEAYAPNISLRARLCDSAASRTPTSGAPTSPA